MLSFSFMKSPWMPTWAWQLLWRHLTARQSRSAVKWMNLFAFFGLIVGVFALTAVVSIMSGLQKDIKDRVLNEKAHLLWEGTPRQGLQAKKEEIVLALGSSLRDVQFILQTEGLLEQVKSQQRGRISGSGVVIQGIEAFGEGAALGTELGNVLDLDVDSKAFIRSAWDLNLAPLEIKVKSFFRSGVYEADRSGLRVDRKVLEEWLGLPRAVSRLEVRLNDPMEVDRFAPLLSKIVGVPMRTWKETEKSLWYSLRLEKIVMTLAVFFIVFLAALSVHLALSVRVAEKTREIGLLRALGVKDKILARLYLLEGAALGLAGSTAGLILSYFFCRIISGYYELPDIYYLANFPVQWEWSTSIGLAFFAVLLSVMASFFPAKKVEGVQIAEALRS